MRGRYDARPPVRFRGNAKAHARGNEAFDLASVLNGVPARDNVLRVMTWEPADSGTAAPLSRLRHRLYAPSCWQPGRAGNQPDVRRARVT
jgi:hypothetical protein